jgi:hypothetical protein
LEYSPGDDKNLQEETYYPGILTFSGFILLKKVIIENTEENRAICRRYCRNCQNYRIHHDDRFPPDGLFCTRGISTCPDRKEIRCYCISCGIVLKNPVQIGDFRTMDFGREPDHPGIPARSRYVRGP